MSDSEEESQDRQLKIVVLGDGTSGKVSPRAGPAPWAAETTVRPGLTGPRGELSAVQLCVLFLCTVGLAWLASGRGLPLAPAPCARARRPPGRTKLLGWVTAETYPSGEDALVCPVRLSAACLVSCRSLAPSLAPVGAGAHSAGRVLSSRGGQDVEGTQGPLP